MIIHIGAHTLRCIMRFMRKFRKNSMMNKGGNSIMNTYAVVLVYYTALCSSLETAYADLWKKQHKICISYSHSAVTVVLYLDFLGM